MFDPTYLFLSISLGLIGMAAFRYGRREASFRHMVLAFALMFLPYFLVEAGSLALVGGGLVVLLFWP